LGNQPRSFYPYGEQKSGSTATEQYAFATYWRDGESGLDYAMGRYYSSTDGRFLSPDPYQNNSGLKNPQGWNRYAYVLNDPINYNDPPGLWASGGGGGGGGSPGAPGGGPMSDMGDQFCEQVAFDFGEFDDMTGGSTLPGYLLANHCPGTYLNNGGGGGGGGGGNPMQIVGKAVTAAANLLTKNKNCAGLFLSPTDNTQAGRKDLAQELGTLVPDGNLVVTTDPSASPTNPAWYDDDGIINILSGGSFFTGKINGKSVLTEGQSLSQFQELLIIHEFLHLTGVVGDDNTNQTITFPNGDKVTGSVGVTDEIEKDYNL
jgi:RHS repeat-associated protein